MLILDEDYRTTILDSIYAPVKSDYFWCLDTTDQDFMLAPLTVLEEITAPTLTLTFGDFSLNVPASWNILVYDNETMQIDSIEISSASGKDFRAFIYGPHEHQQHGVIIKTSHYMPVAKTVAPLLNKHQMLCHPITPAHWVCITPHDVQKHLKNLYVGNLLNF